MPASLWADITLAPLFADGAVLQRERPVAVWGRTTPGERVQASFGGHHGQARASGDGRWSLVLPAMPASARGGELVVVAGVDRVVLRNILIGEVWLCSGQSNMGRTVAREIESGISIGLESLPEVRHFTVDHAVAESPAETLRSSGWQPASPATTGAFTAVGYLFGRELRRKLGVPVGLVHSSWGGTPVESWMSARALGGDPSFATVAEWWRQMQMQYPQSLSKFEAAMAEWNEREKRARERGAEASAEFLARERAPRRPRGGPDDPWRPAALYNAMIHPLIPYTLRGVIWYQGESNAERASQYGALFSAMITSWREDFRQPELPFYWVQLPNYSTASDWPGVREGQAQALALPATGQAVTIDIGDPHDIHPHNKIEVARRLALIALANVYDFSVPFAGPRFASAERVGGAMRVRFSDAAGGLVARGSTVDALEVAGADRIFHSARGRIDGNSLEVTSDAVPEPVAVRYAWSNNPKANLYNQEGLPAAPFRSERW